MKEIKSIMKIEDDCTYWVNIENPTLAMIKEFTKRLKEQCPRTNFIVCSDNVRLVNRYFQLEKEEYLISPEHPNAKDYKIFFKGKEIKDVTGIIRTSIK